MEVVSRYFESLKTLKMVVKEQTKKRLANSKKQQFEFFMGIWGDLGVVYESVGRMQAARFLEQGAGEKELGFLVIASKTLDRIVCSGIMSSHTVNDL